jgi:predicted O-linked N-acetylglucosamine transferase (SPINDLY family)
MSDHMSEEASNALPLRRAAAALRDAGRVDAAAEQLQAAVDAFPDDADAHAELGLTLALAGRTEDAIPHYRRALALAPQDAFAWSNLGAAHMQLSQEADARTCFRRVLEIQPDQPQAQRNLGNLLKQLGELEEARALLLKASERDKSLELAIQAHLALSPILRSEADIEVQRQGYAEGLEALAALPGQFQYRGEKGHLPWFRLAYHGRDDLALATRTGEVLRKKVVVEPSPPSSQPAWTPPAATGRRIRVVFCSEFFHEHTIGRLNRGHIRHLDRQRFEVVVLHGAHSKADAFRAEFDRLADAAHVLPLDPAQQRQVVRRLAPDVLYFTDTGMSAQTYYLAQARLAPVQATTWGHPDTTGLDTLDYFVSMDAAETEGSEAFYGERLVRLPRMSSFYEPPPPPPPVTRATLRLPEAGTLYGCPQSLFKFHPDFDPVLAAIAEGDPDGRIILLEAASPSWTEALRTRWAATHPILLEKVLFVPRLSYLGFLALQAHMDVLLDPLHFGGGNTLYEAMEPGTPMVTLPGRFLRSRLALAAYRQMGVEDAPIATDVDDYVRIALALGRDAGRRDSLKARLAAAAREHLFEDPGAVRGLEAFFTAAVEAAAEGRVLPTGWRPPPARG